ncbi:hypothetical protein BH24ACT9_BH24ACT9_18000 [soil metagenome]
MLRDAPAILAVRAAVVAIGLPIGLPEPGPDYRRADLEARSFLGTWSARNAVFFTPVRPVLAATTYPEAAEISRRLTGMGLSKQTWNILDRVAEADDALGALPYARVIEVHPEVSFRLLDERIDVSKQTARGVGQRIAALATCFDMTDALTDVPAGPGLDDCLDAWSAQRWMPRTARVLGLYADGNTSTDALGRPMRMVA